MLQIGNNGALPLDIPAVPDRVSTPLRIPTPFLARRSIHSHSQTSFLVVAAGYISLLDLHHYSTSRIRTTTLTSASPRPTTIRGGDDGDEMVVLVTVFCRALIPS